MKLCLFLNDKSPQKGLNYNCLSVLCLFTRNHILTRIKIECCHMLSCHYTTKTNLLETNKLSISISIRISSNVRNPWSHAFVSCHEGSYAESYKRNQKQYYCCKWRRIDRNLYPIRTERVTEARSSDESSVAIKEDISLATSVSWQSGFRRKLVAHEIKKYLLIIFCKCSISITIYRLLNKRHNKQETFYVLLQFKNSNNLHIFKTFVSVTANIEGIQRLLKIINN